MMHAGDLSWAMAAGIGRDDIFNRVLEEQSRPMLRLCYRLLGNLADAEDAAQDVFLRAYKHRSELTENRSASPWLYQIALNVCRDRFRARRTVTPLDDASLQSNDSPESSAASGQMRGFLMEALDTLTERERQAIVLRDFEGLSAEDTAAILGSTASTVRSQCTQARAKLRGYLES